MKRKTYKLNNGYKEYEVTLGTATYNDNDRLAIRITTTDGEPFTILTVNLPDEALTGDRKTHAFVDTNNNDFADRFIRENGLGQPTGHIGFSGYCVYPEYKFNLEAF